MADVSATPASSRLVLSTGLQMHVRSWAGSAAAGSAAGSTGTGGSPFVLLHGIAATSVSWLPVAELLAASGREVHALDFRGHGETGRPDDGYDLATYASDVVAALATLGVQRPVLAGHSLGASVALVVATIEPGVLGGVALVEGGLTTPRRQFGSVEECLQRLALPPMAGVPLPRVEAYLRHSNPTWGPARLAAAIACLDVLADGTAAWRLTPPRFEALVRSLWDEDVAAGWDSLAVPVLFIVADTGLAPWTQVRREAAAAATARLPEARVEWIDGDHDIHLARPERVAEALLDAFPEGAA
jgi:pimeloyl-ACP methyl ester carboxylesterase